MTRGNEMNVGSLFSGIGGIERGFELAGGFETKWFVECDPYAQTILRKQFPNAAIYDDVTQIDWRTVPQVDILTGGFPCQDISNAGKRVGITGSRSSLWKHYCEAIRILRPKYAFIENVSALIDRGLDVVLADLASLGYDAEWHCVSAASIGAPHRRDRIFIIAYANSSGQLHSEPQEQSNQGREQALSLSLARGDDVANSYKGRLQAQRTEQQTAGIAGEDAQDLFNSESFRYERKWTSEERRSINTTRTNKFGDGWWATESGICGVAHGVPYRVERIKCLGNAVVPQCAEVFAQAIKEVALYSITKEEHMSQKVKR